MSGLATTLSDTRVIAWRNLLRVVRQPDLLIAFTVQPVMFTLLFVYVFGGAIRTGFEDYADFLIPGIVVQNIAFGGSRPRSGSLTTCARGSSTASGRCPCRARPCSVVAPWPTS